MSRKNVRHIVYNKYEGRCAYCGCTLSSRWHVDHLIPVIRCLRTKAITRPEHDTVENMMPSCPSCNIDKSSMTLESWRKVIANRIKVLNRDVSAYRFAKKFKLVNETNNPVVFYFEQADKN